MENETNVYVIHPNETNYRIKTKWKQLDFNLLLLDGSEAFQTSINKNDLELLAVQYEYSFDAYVNEIKSCLCFGNNGNNFVYERNGLDFIVSRRVERITREIVKFRLENNINFEAATLLFIDDMNAVISTKDEHLNNYRNDLETILKEKNVNALAMEKFIREKSQMENELYSKFILILNEKKLRIQHLEEILRSDLKPKHLETISDSETDNVSNEEITEIAKPKVSLLSGDEDDFNVITSTIPRRKAPDISVQSEQIVVKKVQIEKGSNSKAENSVGESQTDAFHVTTLDLMDRL